MVFTVYVLYSPSSKRTYTGYTSDLENRLQSHNSLAIKGFTIRYRPWIVIYTEVFETKGLALKREKELKTGKGREFVKSLLHKSNK